jgi:hypothetical protein
MGGGGMGEVFRALQDYSRMAEPILLEIQQRDLREGRLSGPPTVSPRCERSNRRRKSSRTTSEEKSKATSVVDWTGRSRQIASLGRGNVVLWTGAIAHAGGVRQMRSNFRPPD